ncbi:hypothetical protein H5410_037728 [Solanum commersonii]|uniref:Uncharacterized protein n=1 Tax=Solanum commersonii TaxID=4109 RepID=A0A9J5YAC0_SOLCO|nr:hypothetical protein H5410_037728 [Solanum commersonii]
MGEKLMGMGAWSDSGMRDAMWIKATNCIREVASKVLGVSRGSQKQREEGCDLDQVKCIKDEEGKVLVDEISMARGGKDTFTNF